jgi:hypothetical protein
MCICICICAYICLWRERVREDFGRSCGTCHYQHSSLACASFLRVYPVASGRRVWENSAHQHPNPHIHLSREQAVCAVGAELSTSHLDAGGSGPHEGEEPLEVADSSVASARGRCVAAGEPRVCQPLLPASMCRLVSVADGFITPVTEA